MNKSIFGLSENLAAALAYVGGFITGIVVLIFERENKFVRFAALQSTIFFLTIGILSTVLGFVAWIPFIGWIPRIIIWIIGVIAFLAWVFLTISAYKNHAVKLPVVGDVCWEQVNK